MVPTTNGRGAGTGAGIGAPEGRLWVGAARGRRRAAAAMRKRRIQSLAEGEPSASAPRVPSTHAMRMQFGKLCMRVSNCGTWRQMQVWYRPNG
eukprot:6187177-Pleurochrysis_carterae.AAC.2